MGPLLSEFGVAAKKEGCGRRADLVLEPRHPAVLTLLASEGE
jgi:hypothetical protein